MDIDQSVSITPGQRFRFEVVHFRQDWETDILCSTINTVNRWPKRAYHPLSKRDFAGQEKIPRLSEDYPGVGTKVRCAVRCL